MTTLSKYQKVGVFVDVQNMFYSAKHQYRAKLNFTKLLEFAVKGRRLIRAIAYIVQTKEVDQKTFIDMLSRTGYEVKSKELKIRPDGTAKGDWDMGIAIDTISLVNRLDTMVLVSGDGDFVDLVNMLKGRGVRVEVISFPRSTADELTKAATQYYPIESDLLIKERRELRQNPKVEEHKRRKVVTKKSTKPSSHQAIRPSPKIPTAVGTGQESYQRQSMRMVPASVPGDRSHRASPTSKPAEQRENGRDFHYGPGKEEAGFSLPSREKRPRRRTLFRRRRDVAPKSE